MIVTTKLSKETRKVLYHMNEEDYTCFFKAVLKNHNTLQKAMDWLFAPLPELGGATPLEAYTTNDARLRSLVQWTRQS